MFSKIFFFFFLTPKSVKNLPQKLLIIVQNLFFLSPSQPTAHSPELIFHIMKSRDQTSVLLSVLIIGPNLLFHSPAHSPKSIFHIIKMSHQASVLLFVIKSMVKYELQCCVDSFTIGRMGHHFSRKLSFEEMGVAQPFGLSRPFSSSV